MNDWEDHFEQVERRESRADRKRARAADRSKYKKSNTQKQKVPEIEGGERGRVVSITGLGIEVAAVDGLLQCTVRGSLKKEATRMRRLVVVGDIVRFERTTEGEGVISAIEPRTTLLTRSDPIHPKKQHPIAANIDQVLITASVVSPPLKPGLIDRYILAAKRGLMDAAIVINKVDLLKDGSEERAVFDELMATYQKLGYPILAVSTVTGEGIEGLLEQMEGKTSAFSGQSGTGKSSLINATLGIERETGAVVARTRKGTHTTTTAQLIHVGKEGWCIDTPGIKSFGVWELQPDEIESYFEEISEIGRSCRYPDCTHTCEPMCAVREAVESGEISQLRYNSYIALRNWAINPPKKR